MVWGAFIGHWHGHGSGKVKEFVMVGVWEGFGSCFYDTHLERVA